MGNGIMALGMLRAGQDAVIRDFNGGQHFHQRLTEMGLVRGMKVGVIKNEIGNPLIISIGEGRLAIGQGMALKILVEEGS